MDYYNENDPVAVAKLRRLIRDELIPNGIVDERSIIEVEPDDLKGYEQCHFFAGIGGWARALRLAKWDGPVWTASCPCQPFSKGNTTAKGFRDTRHLWPAFYRLVAQCRPTTIFGEQVESAITHGWLDGVCEDLEGSDYAVASAVLPASSVGAIHKRNRLYFVADSIGKRRERSGDNDALSYSACETYPVYGDPIAESRSSLAVNFTDLLPFDGVSIGVERRKLKGYGNAIVPKVAAEFISAFMDTL